MAIQRVGHGSNWKDSSNIIKGAQLHLSCYRLFHLVGRDSTIEKSRTEGCDSVHQGVDCSQVLNSPINHE